MLAGERAANADAARCPTLLLTHVYASTDHGRRAARPLQQHRFEFTIPVLVGRCLTSMRRVTTHCTLSTDSGERYSKRAFENEKCLIPDSWTFNNFELTRGPAACISS